uniref:MORN repeat protein n=1 Tax=Leptocylindrus danicus TaxID=163516 RepID=A0A7S2JWF9_9STRA|mmetsp:Transcript_1292/g.1848  ORF Transcript_1292/g.1848 Transcript_1292/m.1848 type:complete len:694 (+) Transcript_1292:325-2406(+)
MMLQMKPLVLVLARKLEFAYNGHIMNVSLMDVAVRKKFSSEHEFDLHCKNDHDWICCCCRSRNKGTHYPVCQVCDNSLGPNGEDLASHYKEATRKALDIINNVISCKSDDENNEEGNFLNKSEVRVRDLNDPATINFLNEVYPKRNGPCKRIHPTGTQICGESVDNQFEGKGAILWRSGSYFVGNFHASVRKGFGIYRGSDGTRYCGNWKSGLRDGYGIAIEPKYQSKYEGYWKNGRMDGVGKLEKADGSFFRGLFVNGKCRRGIHRTASGDICHKTSSAETKEAKPWIISYCNGEKYRGYINSDNEREGKGSTIFSDGSRVVGQWKHGVRDGPGIVRTGVNGGEVLSGYWNKGNFVDLRYLSNSGADSKEDRFSFCKTEDGHATYEHKSGTNFYSGTWENNKRSGNGTYRWSNGSVYEGKFANNKFNGYGKLNLADGTVYVGHFRDNKRHGQGKLVFPNGSRYSGCFENGMFANKGEMKYSTGHTYVGLWKKNRKHGWGKFIYQNTSIYVGDFVADKKHGRGRLVYMPTDDNLREIYEGEWANDKRHGFGKHIYSRTKGEIYVGSWKDGKRHGKGSLQFNDGSKFDGSFENDLKEGHGFHTWNDGSTYNGNFHKDCKHGKGTLTELSGVRYTGEFRSNLKHGAGLMAYPNGDSYEGQWRNNEVSGGNGTHVLNSSSTRTKEENIIALRVYGF